MKVPEVLLSGNHAEIANWRREQASADESRRPDLCVTGIGTARSGRSDQNNL